MNQDTKTLLIIICFFIIVFVLIVYFKPEGEENTVPGSVATTENIPTTDLTTGTTGSLSTDIDDTSDPEIPENHSYTDSTQATAADTTPKKETMSPFTEKELEPADIAPKAESTETTAADTGTTVTDISDDDLTLPPDKEETGTFSFEKGTNKKETLEINDSPALHKQIYYTVKKGDTLFKISRKMYGSGKYFSRIEKANLDIDPDEIEPGVKIIVPALDSKLITPDTTLDTGTKTTKTPAATASTSGKGTYTIKEGDYLQTIAQTLFGDATLWPAIIKANPGINPKRLKIGQKIIIPDNLRAATETGTKATSPSSDGSTYTIQPGDTLGKIAKKLYGKERMWSKIQNVNPNLDPRRLTVGQKIKLPQIKTQDKN